MTKKESILPSLILCLSLAGCGSRTPSDPILIGHLAPESGPAKEIGTHETEGLILAVEQANQQEEKVAGRGVAVLHADTRGNPDLVQPTAVRLIAVNRVAALLGGGDAAEAERLSRVAQQYSLPLLTTSGLPAPALGAFVFPVGVAPEEQGRALARFATQELKADRVAVLTDLRRADSVALAETFAKEFRKIVGSPAVEFTFQKEDEFPGLARQVVAAQPRAVLVAGSADALPRLRAELHSAKLAAQVPLVFGGEEVSDKALTADGDPDRPVYRATAYPAGDAVPTAREFGKTYQERFGRAPDVHAVLAYDSARLLFEALRQAKSANGTKVRDELAKLSNFESLTGPFSFQPDHSPRRAVFVVHLEKGPAKLVKRYEPEPN